MWNAMIKRIVTIMVLQGLAIAPILAEKPGNCLACSDGKGGIELHWFPTGHEWPAGGWQMQDERGRIVLARVRAAEEPFLAGLTPEMAQEVRQYAQELPQSNNVADKTSFFVSLRIATLTNITLARALGLSRTLKRVSAGPHVYMVVGLDAAGKPTSPVLKSPAVDAAVATPPPAGSTGVRALSTADGVLLFWPPAALQPEAPVTHYLVERGLAGQTEGLSVKPVLLNESATADSPRHIDTEAPVEREITYNLYGIDVFGRHTTSVSCTVFHSDFNALAPPDKIKAEGGKGKVTLTWEPNPSPNTRLIYVERAYQGKGTYIELTPKGLPNTVRAYEDTTVPGGVTAYYRLCSYGPRDNPGTPSEPVSAKPQNIVPPPIPKGLKADIERTRIRITWLKSETHVAFYLLERKTAQSEWTRINPKLGQETMYDDPLSDETGGTYLYRLKAVALDNQASPYCKPIEVVVPERSFPPAPLITATESKEGKAVVHFTPGLPAERSAQFLVLRSSAPDQPGVVLGRPLPAAARIYIDAFVHAGDNYWYRVVALNAKGKRSDPSDAFLVTVTTPPIPRPQMPKLQWIETPFKQIKLSFPAPPAGLGLVAVAERKLPGENLWLRLPDTTSDGELLDAKPPQKGAGKIQYRIVFIAPDDVAGEFSPLAEIVL